MLNKKEAVSRIMEFVPPSKDSARIRGIVQSCLEGYGEMRLYVLRARLDEATHATIQKALADNAGNQED